MSPGGSPAPAAAPATPSAALLGATAPAAGARHLAQVRIAVDHPAFDGHFPGHPILPGVALLAEVLAAWRAAAAQLPPALPPVPRPLPLAATKFTAPVGPGAELAIALQVRGRQLQFEVSAGGRPAASGAFGLPE